MAMAAAAPISERCEQMKGSFDRMCGLKLNNESFEAHLKEFSDRIKLMIPQNRKDQQSIRDLQKHIHTTLVDEKMKALFLRRLGLKELPEISELPSSQSLEPLPKDVVITINGFLKVRDSIAFRQSCTWANNDLQHLRGFHHVVTYKAPYLVPSKESPKLGFFAKLLGKKPEVEQEEAKRKYSKYFIVDKKKKPVVIFTGSYDQLQRLMKHNSKLIEATDVVFLDYDEIDKTGQEIKEIKRDLLRLQQALEIKEQAEAVLRSAKEGYVEPVIDSESEVSETDGEGSASERGSATSDSDLDLDTTRRLKERSEEYYKLSKKSELLLIQQAKLERLEKLQKKLKEMAALDNGEMEGIKAVFKVKTLSRKAVANLEKMIKNALDMKLVKGDKKYEVYKYLRSKNKAERGASLAKVAAHLNMDLKEFKKALYKFAGESIVKTTYTLNFDLEASTFGKLMFSGNTQVCTQQQMAIIVTFVDKHFGIDRDDNGSAK